jgi:exonuclease VII small subunit
VGAAFDRAADELYGLPLDEFVPRRDALARELRTAGEREDADRVKRLVKPSAPAWTVNRLARERPDDVRALLEAGDELRRVQEWLLRGEADPGDLRNAVEGERNAVAALVHEGAEILTAAGRAARGDVLERIGETLHAAATDPSVRESLERGRVERDLAAVGLGSFGTSPAPAGSTRRAGRRTAREPDVPEADAPAREAQVQRERSAAARRAAHEAAQAAESAARAAERMRAAADRAVDRATHALEAAEESWERARETLREARDDLAAAEKAAHAARSAASAAEDKAEAKRRQAGDP